MVVAVAHQVREEPRHEVAVAGFLEEVFSLLAHQLFGPGDKFHA